MKTKIAAATAASMLASVGLVASFSPGAHAATPATARTVQTLKRSSSSLKLTATGKQRLGAVHSAATPTAGAVTLVDNYKIGSTTTTGVDETFTDAGTTIGTLGDLLPGQISEPQILPAGTYTVTATATGAAAPAPTIATGTFVVGAGSDVSEVLWQGNGGTTPATFSEFADPVSSVPTGSGVISIRNTSTTAGSVDVYLNGALVTGPNGLDSSSPTTAVNTTVPAGSYTIAIYRHAGDAPVTLPPSTVTALFVTPAILVRADTFIPAYTIDDSLKADTPTGVALNLAGYALGYQFTASDGGVFNYGGFPFEGSTGGEKLNDPVVGGAESPDGLGYWLVASDGGVFSFGAPFEGSTGSLKLNQPIVGMTPVINADGTIGYWLVAADGGVFSFNAPYFGSLGGTTLASPVVSISSDGAGGYLIVEADGSVTDFGPGITTPTTTAAIPGLNKPIVGIATTPDGGGAWLVASDGGVFTVGDAGFYGSTGSVVLNQPVVGISSTYDGLGYTLIAKDGGVFTFGNARFFGSTGSVRLNEPIVGAIN